MISLNIGQNIQKKQCPSFGSFKRLGKFPENNKSMAKALSDIAEFSTSKFQEQEIHVEARQTKSNVPFIDVDIYPLGKGSFFHPNPKLPVRVNVDSVEKVQKPIPRDVKGALERKLAEFTELFGVHKACPPHHKQETTRDVLRRMLQGVSRENLNCLKLVQMKISF